MFLHTKQLAVNNTKRILKLDDPEEQLEEIMSLSIPDQQALSEIMPINKQVRLVNYLLSSYYWNAAKDYLENSLVRSNVLNYISPTNYLEIVFSNDTDDTDVIPLEWFSHQSINQRNLTVFLSPLYYSRTLTNNLPEYYNKNDLEYYSDRYHRDQFKDWLRGNFLNSINYYFGDSGLRYIADHAYPRVIDRALKVINDETLSMSMYAVIDKQTQRALAHYVLRHLNNCVSDSEFGPDEIYQRDSSELSGNSYEYPIGMIRSTLSDSDDNETLF